MPLFKLLRQFFQGLEMSCGKVSSFAINGWRISSFFLVNNIFLSKTLSKKMFQVSSLLTSIPNLMPSEKVANLASPASSSSTHMTAEHSESFVDICVISESVHSPKAKL